jgi:uncharacterized iron-regulated membrane protein
MARSSDSRKGGASGRVRVLRGARSLHALAALWLLVLVVISSTTGILLGWKKNSDTLQPPTQQGRAVSLTQWRPLHELAAVAAAALETELGPGPSDRTVPDRLDVRPADGVVKVLFPADWEVQVDGASAEVRSVARRHSDWIERIHDGSIISDAFKLVAMNALGIGLLLLSASGFWMWYGPKRLRRKRLESRETRPAAHPS